MMNGVASPESLLNFFRMIPERRTQTNPRTYANTATSPLPGKNALVIIAITGSLAPQGMNVTVIAVILRSLSLSMVREAMIPGTPHPVPTRTGMRDFPERPKCLKIRSMTKAILDM